MGHNGDPVVVQVPPPDRLVHVPGDRPFLLIVPADGGGIHVTGPLDQPAFCYGLLQLARDVVFRHSEARSAYTRSTIVAPGGPLPPPPSGP